MANFGSNHIPATLDDLITAYSDKSLDLPKLLILGANDIATVSDGTMGCHVKDVHHLVPATQARSYFKDPALLYTITTNISDCDQIIARRNDVGFTPPLNVNPKFRDVTAYLKDVRVYLKSNLDPAYLEMVQHCMSLRGGNVWVMTVFDKAVNVRARKIVADKEGMEKAIQQYVIKEMEERYPTTADGYLGQLGRAIREMRMSGKNGLDLVHFVPMTLATIHKSFVDAEFTRFQITRIKLSKDDRGVTTMLLQRAYTLHFRHKDGNFQYVDKPVTLEAEAMGFSYVMESKFYEGQLGDGICSADDDAWLAYIKENAGLLLLLYLFSHNAFPTVGENTEEETKASFEAICGFAAQQLTRGEADDSLSKFDFRGRPTNPALVSLHAMARIPRPGFGIGQCKYIKTLRDGVAYLEPTEAVGLNIHHIYAGTGAHAESRMTDCNKRHQALSSPKFGTYLLVAGEHAVPYSNKRLVDTIIDVYDDTWKVDTKRVFMNSKVDISLYPKLQRC
ncbi:hypothetical protein EC991_005689 [Linnemannia zychae]|nr:hypothetical protein EC991_005689 [Linnemannia zychae]